MKSLDQYFDFLSGLNLDPALHEQYVTLATAQTPTVIDSMTPETLHQENTDTLRADGDGRSEVFRLHGALNAGMQTSPNEKRELEGSRGKKTWRRNSPKPF